MRRLAFLPIFLALSFNVVAADEGLRLEGIAYVEGGAEAIEIQVWALGEQVREHPEWQVEAVFAGSIAPGKAFAVDLGEARLPVQVELGAEGHVGVALQVVIPEQLKLTPAWLREGEAVPVRVNLPGGKNQQAAVFGGSGFDRWSWDFRRWRAAIPHIELEAGGLIEVQLPPGSRYLWLAGVAGDGSWGRVEKENPASGGAALLEIDSKGVAVRVWDQRKRPVPGVRLADARSPLETAVVTDEEGRAEVQVAPGEWHVVARGDHVRGTAVGRDGSEGEVDLDLEPASELKVRWPEALGTTVFQMSAWDPFGKTPRALSGGAAIIAKTNNSGWVEHWGPGSSAGRTRFEDRPEVVALQMRPASRIQGSVVTAAKIPVAGLPVWVRLSLAAMPTTLYVPSGRAARLERPWMPWTVTDREGRFEIDGLAPVECEIEVRAPGLPTARSPRLSLEPGGTVQTTVTLQQGAWVSLRATDPEGVPLPGVVVELERGDPKILRRGPTFVMGERARIGDPELTGSTDEEGRCRLEAVPIGAVRLRLARPGLVPLLLDGIEVTAAGLDLGDQALEPGVNLAGTTVGPDGKPVGGAEVAMTRDASSFFFQVSTTSSEDGSFAIADLQAVGEIYLQARAKGLVPKVPLKVEMPPAGEVEVAMAEERVLRGRVVDARDELPIEGAKVGAGRTRRSRGGFSQSWSGATRSETGADGLFEIDGLSSGSYQLHVEADARQSTTRQIVIGEGDPEPVVVRLEPGLELRGRVESAEGEAVDGVMVSASPASRSWDGSSGGYSQTQTDADGRFHFDDLGPGTQSIAARNQVGATAEGTAEAGQLEPVILRFPRETTIRGTVFGPNGDPVADASVQGYCRTASGGRAADETGPDGRYELRATAVGQWDLVAIAEGLVVAFEKVEIREGEQANVDFRLERGAIVVGEIRGVDAAELGNCDVSVESAWARPDRDGSFRIEGVAAGEQRVRARLSRVGRERSVPVQVPETGESSPVVIDFETGLTVRGRVLRRGTGVPGMTVSVDGPAMGWAAETMSGPDGAWRVEGLAPGEYRVEALSPAGEVVAGDHVLLELDAELDLHIPGGLLRGRVLESETRLPVNGAQVTVSGSAVPPIHRTVGSDRGGSFEVADLGDGDYVVRAAADGLSPAQETIVVSEGSVAEVELLLGDEGPTVFVVREADGSAPAQIWVLGSLGGRIGPPVSARCGAGGRCELSQFPAGRWTLAVGSGWGALLLAADLPADNIPVQLREIGRLTVKAPAGSGGAAWQIRTSDPVTGLVWPVHEYFNPSRSEWVVVPAAGLGYALPGGSWRIEAAAPDGTMSVREVRVPGGGEVTVGLE